ncbi:MAG: type VII secretion protein EccB [Pseudonocardia sp.]
MTGPVRGLRAPATRDQVDAHRFGLRRLESALVRGDAVLLHEPLRTQRRAAAGGVLLAALAVAVAAALALVAPRPDWTRQAVVVGRESGAMYVVAHGPDRLVPVANLVAARLVLGALQRGGSAGGAPATAVPVVVPDEALTAAPRTAAAGVAGAESVRLDAAPVPARWAVCDEVEAGTAGRVRLTGTTVVAGGPPLVEPAGDGVLLLGPDGSVWLVAAGVRHEIDVRDGLVLTTLGLTGAVPRPASAALLSALPVGVRLSRPAIPGTGRPGPAGRAVGDVLAVRAAGTAPRAFVVLADGLQPVSPALAAVLAGRAPREVDAAAVADVPVVERLDVRGWPDAAPRLTDLAAAPVTCWTWSGEDGPQGRVLLGRAVPAPPGVRPVALAQADGAGPLLDAVVLGSGGGPVRSVAAAGPLDSGGLALVSETGVVHGIADADTAAALGIDAASPAPREALDLLPTGPRLDVRDAGALVDVPVAAGG